VTHDPVLLAVFPVAVVGAWLITFLAMAVIGALAFYVESSGALFEVWLALFGVFAGYLIPLELFPRWLAIVARFLPFRYMLAFPVEMIVGMTPRRAALAELAVQWLFVVVLALAARATWRLGLRRFAAYGG
jgi:ABC-2 type transport system permease protein